MHVHHMSRIDSKVAKKKGADSLVSKEEFFRKNRVAKSHMEKKKQTKATGYAA
jgi:hypothetical protein